MDHAFEMAATTLRIAWRLVIPVVAIAILLGTFSRHSAPSVGAEAPDSQPVVLRNEGEIVRIVATLSERKNLPYVIFQTSSGQELFRIYSVNNKCTEIMFFGENKIRAALDPSGERPFFFSTHGPREDTIVKVQADGSTDLAVGSLADVHSMFTRFYHSEESSKAEDSAPGVRP